MLLFGFAFFGIAALRVGREMREIEAKQAEGLRADAATRAASLEASLEADAAGRRAQAAEVEQHLSRVMEAIVASQRLPNQMAYAWVLRESLERYDEAIKLTQSKLRFTRIRLRQFISVASIVQTLTIIDLKPNVIAYATGSLTSLQTCRQRLLGWNAI